MELLRTKGTERVVMPCRQEACETGLCLPSANRLRSSFSATVPQSQVLSPSRFSMRIFLRSRQEPGINEISGVCGISFTGM